MADSAIEWTDKTWNPTVGCDKVSAGCTNCYAMRLANRLEAMGQAPYAGLTRKLPDGSVNWTGVVRMMGDRLEIPLKWKKPARIFVDSMSDLFHPDVDEKFIAKVFGIMDLARQHTYQVLTKRPGRAASLLADEDFQFHVGWFQSMAVRELGLPDPGNNIGPWPLRNVWIGTSVEDQRAADERIPLLLQTPAAVRFLSCEPLIGPVNLSSYLGLEWELPPGGYRPVEKPGVDWVIAGGESGKGYRSMDLDWARLLRDQCQVAGVAFFCKQSSGPRHGMHRELDGRMWEEFPEPVFRAESPVGAKSV